MKNHFLHIFLSVASVAALLSCTREVVLSEDAVSDVPIQINTKSGEDKIDLPFRLYFVRSNMFSQIGTEHYSPYFEHYFESMETYNLDKGRFNTNKFYPANYNNVYVSGFAPAMKEDNGDVDNAFDDTVNHGGLLDMTDHHKRVRVNYGSAEYDNSKWAGIAVAGPVVGNTLDPISASEDDVLKFHYATIRVSFRAYKTVNMQNLGIRNVRVIVRPQNVPVSLMWNSNLGAYLPAGDGSRTMEIGLKNNTDNNVILPDIDQNKITNYYYVCREHQDVVVPHMIVNLAVEYYDVNSDNLLSKRLYENVEIPLRDNGGNPVSNVKPGDSYLVTIVFDQDSFEIKGEMEDWQDGGNFNIPVVNPVNHADSQ